MLNGMRDANMVASSKCLVSTWQPMGSPSFDFPQER